jgi:hypothetical protein
MRTEEITFEVTRSRFIQFSEAFAGAFRLLQVEGGTDGVDEEGRTKAHPIDLEGYKAADFAALVKVLYPS